MPTKSLLPTNTPAILNAAIAAELYAANLYKHVANQMQRLGYFGAQKFLLAESQHELGHYQILVDYMDERGAMADMPAVPAITETCSSLRDAIEIAYETELQLERDYVGWYKACPCEITRQFLLQFLEIQRKAVGEMSDWIARLDRCGTDNAAVLILDKELGE